MPTASFTAEIPASPDKVWGVIKDLGKYSEWNVTHVAFPDGTPSLDEGAQFREQVTIMGMPGEASWTVSEIDGSHFALSGQGPMGVMLGQKVSITPTADGNGTTIQFEASFDGGPLAGPMGESIKASAEKAAEQSLEKLKGLVV
jgi:carbon monoxide dehydrogenase subunit G